MFESEARAALENRRRGRESSISLELVSLDFTLCNDFFAVLDLLNFVQRGFFDAIHIFPPTATWSRSRHSGVLRKNHPRSRSAHLELSSLTPAEGETVRIANFVLESLAWCSEQALACPVKVVALTIIFPEDLGGHDDGPSSIWALRGIQLLEGIRDAAVQLHICASSREADFKRPTWSLFYVSPTSNSSVYCLVSSAVFKQ